jgi:D-3-phosphoglycerate dehydrogenase
MRVLLVDSIDPSGEALLRAKAELLYCQEASFDGIRRAAVEADAIITRSRLPDDVFEAAPKVRAVTIHGTGTDLVPRAPASERGILIANLPGGNAQSVAEYCVMALLVLARSLVEIHSRLKATPWDEVRLLGAKSHEITGLTVGLVGVGEIGKRIAHICRNGFGMKVLGNRRRMDRADPNAEPAELDDLVERSDAIIVTCPLSPETYHLFEAKRIARMKKTAWLINAGRGAVIDESALIDALREKRIGGAMLDVYEHYRLEPGHPLLALETAVLTPHLAGMTVESRGRVSVLAAEDTLRMLAGERPRHLVNPEAWDAFTMRFSGKKKTA